MRKVMYIGKKDTKADNVNHVPARIWRGLGDVLEVGDMEAAKLTEGFSDIWLDVSALSEDDRKALVESFQKEFAKERRATADRNAQSPNLGVATMDELEAEIEKRQRQLSPTDPKARDGQPLPKGTITGKRPDAVIEKERPRDSTILLGEICTAIQTMDVENKQHFDGDGRPNLEVIMGLLGYKVSNSELDHALKQIG